LEREPSREAAFCKGKRKVSVGDPRGCRLPQRYVDHDGGIGFSRKGRPEKKKQGLKKGEGKLLPLSREKGRMVWRRGGEKERSLQETGGKSRLSEGVQKDVSPGE